MRLLGASEYGAMVTVLSAAMITTVLADWGILQYSVREVARHRAEASRYFTNFFISRLVLSLLAIGLLMLWAIWLKYNIWSTFFAALYAQALSLMTYGRGFFHAFEDLRADAVTVVIEKILVIIAGLALLVWYKNSTATLAGMALGMISTTSISVIWISHRIAPINLKLLDWQFIRNGFRIAIIFGLAALFNQIYYRIDIVMLESMKGEVVAGQYGIAARILETLFLLPTIVTHAAIYPRLIGLQHQGEKNAFQGLFRSGLISLTAISVIVSLALMYASPWMIQLLDPDPQFVPAGPALQVLIWTFPLVCINSMFYSALVSIDRQHRLALFIAGTVIMNILLNLLLIPLQGIQGAALATVLSELALLIAYAIQFRMDFKK